MNPGTFVTLLIFSWLLLAGVTLWALLRVSMRRARLQRSYGENAHTHALPGEPASAVDAVPAETPGKRHVGWLVWNHR